MKNQKGFTLVEMAIVLVIIGLLLGGVLKGQELIESSRIKNAANDINGVIAAYNGYVDRFRAVPGDDINATSARGDAWTSAAAPTTSNGQLPSDDPFTGTGETLQFWVHLRAAGFIAGNPKDATIGSLPKNAFSGLIGVTGAEILGTAAVQGGAAAGPTIPAGTPKVCLSNVPGKAARALDIAMDDGSSGSGIMRGIVGTSITANPAPDYSDNDTYTLCRVM